MKPKSIRRNSPEPKRTPEDDYEQELRLRMREKKKRVGGKYKPSRHSR